MADVDDLIAELGGGQGGQPTPAPAPSADPVDSLLDDIDGNRGAPRFGMLARQAKAAGLESPDSGVVRIARKGGTSKTEAAGEGFIQGATGGWADELAGVAQKFDISRKAGSRGGAQASEKAGAAATGQARERNEELREAEPGAFMGGEIAGTLATALVPGGQATKAARVGRAAVEGGVAGAGFSDADSISGRLVGAAGGAALGAGLAVAVPAVAQAVKNAGRKVANKVIEKAKPWAEQRLKDGALTKITAGAKPTQKAAILDDADALLKEADEIGVDPTKAADFETAARSSAAQLTDEAGKLKSSIKTRAGAVELDNVMEALRVSRDRAAANPAMASQAKKLDKLIADTEARFAKAKPPQPLDDAEVLQLVANKAPTSVKQKLGQRPDQVVAQVRKFGLDKAAEEGAEQFAAKSQEAVQTVGKRIGELTDELQLYSEGVPVKDFAKRLLGMQKELAKNPARKAEADAVWAFTKNVSDAWGGLKGTVPIRQFRQMVSELQASGFTGNILDPGAQKAFKRQLAGTAKGFLDDHIDSLASERWAPKDAKKLQAIVEELREQNATFSVLKDVEKAAVKRANAARIKPEAAKPPTPIGGPGELTLQQLDDMVEAMPASSPARESLGALSEQRFAAAAGDDLEKLRGLETKAQRRELLAESARARKVSELGNDRRPASAGGVVEKLTGLGPSGVLAMLDPSLGASAFMAGLAKRYGPRYVDRLAERLTRIKTLADKGAKPETLFKAAARLGISREIASQVIAPGARAMEAAPAGGVPAMLSQGE